jgi:hypothetical protein
MREKQSCVCFLLKEVSYSKQTRFFNIRKTHTHNRCIFSTYMYRILEMPLNSCKVMMMVLIFPMEACLSVASRLETSPQQDGWWRSLLKPK